MKKKLFIFIITISFITSCSNDISQETAKDLIIQKYKFPLIETILLPKDLECKATVLGGTSDSWRFYQVHKRKLDTLVSEGLIILEEWLEGDPEKDPLYHKLILLTEEGKKYLIKEDESGFELKANEITFGEVTDFKQTKGEDLEKIMGKHAGATYYLKRTNITPFGKAFFPHEKNIDKRQIFTLLDNGWVIDNSLSMDYEIGGEDYRIGWGIELDWEIEQYDRHIEQKRDKGK